MTADPCNESKLSAFAKAIAYAEGYYSGPHTRPARNNNPGDFMGSGDSGKDLQGYAIYSRPEAGWKRLCSQLALIRDGKSHIYNLKMSLADMAMKWTETEQKAWAQNVAGKLGVSTGAVLSDLLLDTPIAVDPELGTT